MTGRTHSIELLRSLQGLQTNYTHPPPSPSLSFSHFLWWERSDVIWLSLLFHTPLLRLGWLCQQKHPVRQAHKYIHTHTRTHTRTQSLAFESSAVAISLLHNTNTLTHLQVHNTHTHTYSHITMKILFNLQLNLLLETNSKQQSGYDNCHDWPWESKKVRSGL
jgi:hypothetical protein